MHLVGFYYKNFTGVEFYVTDFRPFVLALKTSVHTAVTTRQVLISPHVHQISSLVPAKCRRTVCILISFIYVFIENKPGWTVQGPNPSDSMRFYLLHTNPDSPGAHAPYCTMGIGALTNHPQRGGLRLCLYCFLWAVMAC